MTDLSTDWETGEYSKGSELEDVEYAGTVAVGDPLKITGKNAAGQMKVQKATGTDVVRFFAVKEGAGKSGDIKAALCRGNIKPGIGFAANTVEVGTRIALTGGKMGIAAANAKHFGWSRVDVEAADDTGLIYFDGGLN